MIKKKVMKQFMEKTLCILIYDYVLLAAIIMTIIIIIQNNNHQEKNELNTLWGSSLTVRGTGPSQSFLSNKLWNFTSSAPLLAHLQGSAEVCWGVWCTSALTLHPHCKHCLLFTTLSSREMDPGEASLNMEHQLLCLPAAPYQRGPQWPLDGSRSDLFSWAGG